MLTLTIRSLPQVTIRPLDGSMSMRLMLCLPSWNVANAIRLHQHAGKMLESIKCDWLGKKPLNSLFFFDRLKAGVAHPHGELEAHDRVRGAFGTAFSTNGLSALPAVVLQKHRCAVTHEEGSQTNAGCAVPYLPETQGLTVPHLLDVPEERLLALLTRVTV